MSDYPETYPGSGLHIFKMPQDNTFHLARTNDIETVGGWGNTRALCGGIFGSSTGFAPDEILAPNSVIGKPEDTMVSRLPFYRGRNEWTRCKACDTAARA